MDRRAAAQAGKYVPPGKGASGLFERGHFFIPRLPNGGRDERQRNDYWERAMQHGKVNARAYARGNMGSGAVGGYTGRIMRLLRQIGRDLPLMWFAMRDPATPRALKFGAMLLAVYLLSPIDLAPDWLPVLGWLDDFTVLALVLPLLRARLPEPVLERARKRTHSAAARFSIGSWFAR
jgi:uncharacterized membrane protein YkvA (DUF1232 family)